MYYLVYKHLYNMTLNLVVAFCFVLFVFVSQIPNTKYHLTLAKVPVSLPLDEKNYHNLYMLK